MGKDYAYQVTYAATPSRVYQVLTSAEGLAGWWTTTCDVSQVESLPGGSPKQYVETGVGKPFDAALGALRP
jgi:uncharacterized protein YndB with AHSA1/START domain